MSGKNQESVKLLIEAEYLADEEFAKASNDVKALAKASEKTDKALDQLKIDKETIKSYGLLGHEINELQGDIEQALIAQKESAKEFGKTSKEYKDASSAVRTLNQDLASLKKSYTAQGNTLKQYRVDSKNVEQTVTDLNDKIAKTAELSKKQANELKEASASLEQATARQRALANEKQRLSEIEEQLALERKQLASSMKAEFEAQEKLNKATKDAIAQRKAEIEEVKKSKLAKEAEQDAIKATQVAISKYESQLRKLNEEKRSGNLSQADWIRAEDKLRKDLKLSTQQIAIHKKAIEAEEKELSKKSNTTKTLAERLIDYQQSLKKLNEEKASGKITTAQLEKEERKLRIQYDLTEGQIKRHTIALEKNERATAKANKSTDLLTTATRRIAQAYVVALAIGKVSEAVTATTASYGELEGAMTRVSKTTGLAHDELVDLKDSLNEMATEITPSATNELLKYAEVAGQLGISSKSNLLDMAVASDALAVSTNLAGEEASLLLTRMLLMTDEGVDHIHNLASSVTELGNNFAVAEDEIVHMAREVITATSAMGVGTSSAVAFGATLKEAGQQAERSRTALQRMAQSITQASKNGGEDLIKLMSITGLTADEIEKNLGDRPEQIMLKFAEGLKRIKDEGGLVSETLEGMGIKSLESQAVLEVLADKSVRLADALYQSEQAYISHDKHLIEASKVYADQASAVGRLTNRFEELKANIGEALTDELAEGMSDVTVIMEETEGVIVELMQLMGSLITDITGEMRDLLPVVQEVAGAFYHLGKGIQVSFNLAQVALDKISVSADELWLAQLEKLGATKEQTKELEDQITASQNRIESNWQQALNASLIITGKASESYLNLQRAVKGNDEAIERLTESEKEQLKVALQANGYLEENNQIYNRLTSSITRNVSAVNLEKKSTELANKTRAEDNKVNERRIKLADDLKASNVSLVEHREKMQKQLEAGLITEYKYTEVKNDLIAIEDKIAQQNKEKLADQEKLNATERAKIADQLKLLEISDLASDSTKELTTSTNKYLAELNELQTQMVGLNVTSKKYLDLQKEIDAINGELAISQNNLRIQKELESKTQAELVAIQQEHYDKLELLARQYNHNAITAKEYADEKEKLAFTTEFLTQNIQIETDAEEELGKVRSGVTEKTIEQIAQEKALAKAKKAEVAEAEKSLAVKGLEAQSIQALTIAQAQHQDKLDYLKKQYQDGTITFIEYSARMADAKEVTDFLNNALKDATQSTKEFGDSAEKAGSQWVNASSHIEYASARLEKLKERADSASESGGGLAQMITASASAFDATTASTKELSEEIETLEGRIYQNSKVMRDSWWHGLATAQLELDRTSLATAKQAKAILALQNRYENLENPTRVATQAIADSIDSMGDLDNATLNSLRDEVEATIKSFDDMRDSINDALDSVEDRLSRLKGEEIAIQERAHERELADAEAQKESAKGDSEALAKAELLIKKLKEAQAIERNNLKAEVDEAKAESVARQQEKENVVKEQSTPTPTARASTTPTVTTSASNVQPIIINLGAKSTELTANKDDIMNLLTEMGYTLS